MCGIAGMLGGADERALRVMTQMLWHRGPDDGAIWMDAEGRAGFGHRRLAIIDPRPDARQPMRSADGRHTLTFNGEIFNFRELRGELRARGRTFRTESDSEVLLAALAEWGEEALARIEGQFAFAWWDALAGRAVLARDHLGIKPLYFSQSGPKLLFASEIKALCAVDPALRRMHTRMLSRRLAFLWTPGADTLFEGVHALEPGSVLVWRDGRHTVRRHWDPVEVALRPRLEDASAESRREELAARVHAAVRSQLVSDVPLGILLSGGIDSTVILASASAHGRTPPSVFTATYAPSTRAADVFDDDAPYARLAAARYGAEMHETTLEQRVTELLPRAVWHLDEPLGDPTVLANLELTHAAKPRLTVLLSGMGADEIFAGYPRYPAVLYGTHASRLPAFVPRAAAGLLRAGVRARLVSAVQARRPLHVLDRMHGPLRDRFLAYSTWWTQEQQRALLAPDFAREADIDGVYEHHLALFERVKHASPLQQMLAVDLCTYLPQLNLENTDKTAMASAVEVRVPFLDRALVEFALSLPDRDRIRRFERKALFRRAFAGELPAEIVHRRKTGYAPPVRGWMRGPLREWARDRVLGAFDARGFTQPGVLARMFDENDAGTHDHSVQLWQLVVIEEWMRQFIDGFDAAPAHAPEELDVIA